MDLNPSTTWAALANARPRQIGEDVHGLRIEFAFGVASAELRHVIGGVEQFAYAQLSSGCQLCLMDYQSGSSADVFHAPDDAHLILYPGFRFLPVFLARLHSALDEAFGVTAISDHNQPDITDEELFDNAC